MPVDNVGQLLHSALVCGGIIGIDEDIEPETQTIAFRFANWLLAEWGRKRFMAYALEEYSFVSTGHQTYSVGAGEIVDINPRPERLQYAYMRFLQHTESPGQFPVDIPLDIISSKEDYSRIAVKNVGTLPWRVFYDPQWPVGVLHPWPVPQQGLYGLHFGFKVVLPRFTSLTQQVTFPPEYEQALVWAMARRLRAAFALPPSPEITSLARNAINTIRLANQAVWTQPIPIYLRSRNRAYDVRGDLG